MNLQQRAREQLPGTAGTVDLTRLFPIHPRSSGTRLLLGLGILAVLVTAFWLGDVSSFDPSEVGGSAWGPALFFSVIIAYAVPIYGYISDRTVGALDTLTPVLEAEPEQIAEWRRRICEKPVRWLVTVLTIGVASGFVHNLLLNGSIGAMLARVSSSPGIASISIGTALTWIVVTLVVAGLLDNALLFNRIAGSAKVNPFDVRALRPFATVAVISTLALIGAQAAFPIMTLRQEADALAYGPGLLATGVPMLLIAALPVWPVHRRLAAAKRQILEEVNRCIGNLPLPEPERVETLREITSLLSYRREVMQLSEWPFDVGVMARLGLYLIIPPLTWVGAALIENIVEGFL